MRKQKYTNKAIHIKQECKKNKPKLKIQQKEHRTKLTNTTVKLIIYVYMYTA